MRPVIPAGYSMDKSALRLFYWAPRLLAILLALIPAALTYSRFGAGDLDRAIPLDVILEHLLPRIPILVVLAAAWKWEWIGGVCFTAVAVAWEVTTWGEAHPAVQLMIVGPPLVIGG